MTTRDGQTFFVMSSGGGVRLDSYSYTIPSAVCGRDNQSGTVVAGGGNLRRPISSGPRQKRRFALGDPTYFLSGRSFVGDRWGWTSMLSADTVVMIVGVPPVPGTGSSVMCGFR